MRTPSLILRRPQKRGGGAMDEIARIGRQTGVAAGELDSGPAAGKRQPVAEVHRVKDGFEVMKAVRSPAEDVQQQVDFAG